MIRAEEQRLPRRDRMFPVVPENKRRASGNYSAIAQDGEIHVESDLPQGYYNFQVRHQVQLPFQKAAAIPHLFG